MDSKACYNMKFRNNLIFAVILLIFITSCTNKNQHVEHMMQGDTLIEQASVDDNNDAKVRYVFQAIDKYIDGKLFNKADKLLLAVDTGKLNKSQLNTYNFLQAKYNYEILKPYKANNYLVKVKVRANSFGADSKEKIKDYYKLKYQINYALNHNEEAIVSQIQYNKFIEDISFNQFKENNKEIWDNLVKLSKSQLLTLKQENSDDPHIQGWLDLALVFNPGGQELDTYKKLTDWYSVNPRHDAVKLAILKEENTFKKLDKYKPHVIKKITLLLPMSGKYKNIAEPIKLGFLSAYYTRKGNQDLKISFVDSAKEYDINSLDADVIIGPLLKTEVKKVIKNKKHDNVKVLALNYSKTSSNDNVFQFGISAEDEAEQAALRVSNLGFQNTLIIAEQSSWGERVAKAFSSKFEEVNNTVVEKSFLDKNSDYQAKIRNLLGIDDSNYRKYKLSRALNAKLSHTPQRRKDIDNIFIALPANQAKQVVPLLKYFYAEDLPVFSTSSVYNEKAFDNNNNDLNNVQFCDIPGNLPENKNNNEFDYRAYLTAKMPKNLSENRRIFALGVDAFNVALKLNDLEQMPFMVINGVTGKLNLSEKNKIKRNLSWAKIQKHKIVSLG